MKRLFLLYLVLFPVSLYGQSLFNDIFRDEGRESALEDSINVLLSDIYFAIDLIDELEAQKDSLQRLYEFEKQNIKTITEIQQVEVIKIQKDTITVTQKGFNTDTQFTIPFNITNYLNGSVYNLEGKTSFLWDFENNLPVSTTTEILSLRLNLNVSTTLIPKGSTYLIETQPTTPQIRISDNVGNVLTEDDYIRRVPSRLGIGLIGGYGFSYQGVTPYAGIGVTFNFYELSELFRR